MSKKVFLIGVSHRNSPLDELQRLVSALGYQVAGQMTSKSNRVHPDSYFGPGLIKRLVEASQGCQAVIADSELSPRQARLLSEATNLEVLDRTDIILRLFAARARTSAGKMQVDLAQAEHDLARLRGRWTHLERQGGGRNKGAGEKQSEEDRRQLNRRISLLRGRIGDLEKQRASQRLARERSEVFRVVLVGYTNAGKSTLLSILTGSETASSPRPFETLDPMTRRLDTPRGPILLSDTVGFIAKLPTELVAAFRATLDEVRGADLIIHVADGADINFWHNRNVVLQTLEQLSVMDRPRLDVITHLDKTQAPLHLPGAYHLSAINGLGVTEFKQDLINYRDSQLCLVEAVVDGQDSFIISELARYDRGLSIHGDEGGRLAVRALLPESVAQRLRGHLLPSTTQFSSS